MNSTWRLRVELADSPGALARVTIRLADADCNVLALSVIPVPGGVLDELVVQTGPGVLPADLVAAVRSEGGRCVGITPANLRDLVDSPTAALRAAANAMQDGNVTDALRKVLAADSVVVSPDEPTDEPGHHIRMTAPDGTVVEARRGWSPFTQVELARGKALLDLLSVPPPRIRAAMSDDGMALVLRPGLPSDENAVADLHTRCSLRTMFSRYHAGMRSVPRRWLHRLLSPPRGSTILVQCADRVIALGQLIRMSTPECAEVSLLVEDAWQHRGVGTALLSALADTARAAGYRELVAWCLPSEDGLRRTAERAGLPSSVRREDGLLRVTLHPHAGTIQRPIATLSLDNSR
ncbi:hypothetical protein Lesp02_18100 [Lentzea sp. NBRC 105346]|uniref:GNAT family N-acetyltransferase n=1 Tax=Lentzea sp. NBRC 105346 TaxID=3032205 RepID=UPI0024A05245|nr:GNAT family N-acetyltransferase [Lentzea sp. NBRC 105346]GLZ29620.1 hypothetical protein Lesp02_18100 [Lentzea sp. NBRC 105346]